MSRAMRKWSVFGFLQTVLVAVMLCGAQPAQTQDDAFVWTNYTTHHGLASNAVSSIAVEGDRHVWVGTFGGGVSRFDGQGWFTYSTGHGLADDWVTAVVVDSDDGVWAGTYGGGLSHFNGTRWTTCTTADSGLAGDWITALAMDSSGNLWVGTDGSGVSRFDGQSWQTFTPVNSGLASFWLTALAADGDTLWVGTSDSGLSRYDGRAWETYSTANSALVDDHINAIAVDGRGWVWVGTDYGVNAFDGQSWRTYTAADGLANDQVKAIACDFQGHLWFGTTRGVSVFDGVNWTTYTVRNGLATDYVSAIAVGSQGDLWFGTLGGGVSVLSQPRELPPPPLPVVLVHGWQDSERVEESQFRYMARWLEDDGFPVYYAAGIGPEYNLYRNAQKLKETIERARAERGASQVNLIAHSMGGLVARAYLESELYGGDVAQVFMLGTPQAGLDLWHGYLLRRIVRDPGMPSLQELSPEHALLFNRAHHPRPDVPYYLIAGDYREIDRKGRGSPWNNRKGLPLHLPPGDGIVTLASAHALVGPSIYPITTADLHGWGTDISLLDLPSYLWPDKTYNTYLRNQLRAPGNMTSRLAPASAKAEAMQVQTPFVEGHLSAGQVVTKTVAIDSRGPARFHLTWDEGDLSLTLVDPRGRRIDEREAEKLSLGTDIMTHLESYVVEEASPGRWQMVIAREDDGSRPISFSAWAALESKLTLTLSTDTELYEWGQEMIITATLITPGGPVTGAAVKAEVVRPDGLSESISLLDDGAHHDQAVRDGVYGGIYPDANMGGYYPLFVSAHGSWQGREFERGAEILVPVSPRSASLAGLYTARGQDVNGDGRYERLLVDARVKVARAGEFALAGTLADSQGNEVASTVAYASLDVGLQVMTLPFDGVWAHGFPGPYWLSQVILMDISGAAIEVDEASHVLLVGGYRDHD